MNSLIDKHRSHLKLVELAGKNRFFCRLSAELAVLALRCGILPFNKIEMTG
jgi:hypothetical protein